MSCLEILAKLPVFTGKGCVNELAQVLECMGNPQNRIKCVHVTGTNGKGSVCAMIEHALSCAGYKTGLFTSPYLVRFNERIRVAGKEADDETLNLSAQRVMKVLEELNGHKDINLTQFGFVTAMMFDIFARENVEMAVIEAGMGGGKDPTVLCDPLACVITGVDLDHTTVLGDVLEKIAEEKSGIIKPNVPIILGLCEDSVAEVVYRKAQKCHAEFIRITDTDITDKHWDFNGTEFCYKNIPYSLALLGEYQIGNGAVAAACVESLMRYNESKTDGEYKPTHILNPRDIDGAVWQGRLDLRRMNGYDVLLDGAHNEAGAKALSKFLISVKDRPVIMVTAIMKDKDYENICAQFAHAADAVITVNIKDNLRALPCEQLKTVFEKYGVRAYEKPNVTEGLKYARELSSDSGEYANALTVVCGSLYLVGEVLNIAEMEKI